MRSKRFLLISITAVALDSIAGASAVLATPTSGVTTTTIEDGATIERHTRRKELTDRIYHPTLRATMRSLRLRVDSRS